MKAITQNVKYAKVYIKEELMESIERGLLIFLCIEIGDNEVSASKLAERIIKHRVFEDPSNYRKKLDINDINGQMLVISQFTICADNKKGTKPSFSKASDPDEALKLYNLFIDKLRTSTNLVVKSGQFRAFMDIELVNEGPFTLVFNQD